MNTLFDLRLIGLILAMSCAGKQPDSGPKKLAAPTGCDTLDPALCSLPFPSSYFLAEAETETGWQVAFGPDSLPINRDDIRIRPDYWNEKDGFSPSSQLMTWFEDLSDDGLISHTDLAAYTDPAATTVILDMETSERIPHWAELMIADDPEESLLLIRPAVRLEDNRRYAVAIRGLTRTDGSPVKSSAAFETLRDGASSKEHDIEDRRGSFEEIFTALQGDGIDRGELQLAWNFHTASRSSTLGRMEQIRDDALDRVGSQGPSYVIDDVIEPGCDGGQLIGRSLEGHMSVPMYTEEVGPPTLLTRDEAGQPFYNGDTDVPFIIRFPCSVLDDPRPSQLVHMGHGLLGYYEEVRADYLNELAYENRWVLFSVPWRGMTDEDRGPIILVIAEDPSDFAKIPERGMQGMVGMVSAMRMMRGAMATDPLAMVGDIPLIDTDEPAYYGNSQGAILGAAYTAMSPDVTRAALGVGGAPFSLLLDRSIDFTPFLMVLDQKFTDERDVGLFINGLSQQLWDPAEAAGWLHEMDGKDVLLHDAIGDAEVTTLGAHIMARSFGADLITPATRDVFGLSERAPGTRGSALVEWRYTDVPDAPIEPFPPGKFTSPHECPRRQPDAQAQIGAFIGTGIVEEVCDGPCEAVREEWCDGM